MWRGFLKETKKINKFTFFAFLWWLIKLLGIISSFMKTENLSQILALPLFFHPFTWIIENRVLKKDENYLSTDWPFAPGNMSEFSSYSKLLCYMDFTGSSIALVCSLSLWNVFRVNWSWWGAWLGILVRSVLLVSRGKYFIRFMVLLGISLSCQPLQEL